MRDFFKYTFATVMGLLIVMGLSVAGLISLLVLAATRDTGPRVKNKSVLVFNLATNITDTRSSSDSFLEEALSSDEPTESITLRSLLNTLDQAAKDDRIVGLYLYGTDEGGSGGFATLKEVRGALQRFRATGKQIIAYDTNWREREYYLASLANQVILNPVGGLEMNGLSLEQTFFASALQKFGVGVQVTRVGKYKSAVEPYLRNDFSPEDRQQNAMLLNDLWNDFITATSKDRKRTPQQFQEIVNNQGLLTAQDALKQGLVDRLAYQDEVLADLKRLTGKKDTDKTFTQISLQSYSRVAADKLAQAKRSDNEVAVVYAEGAIVDGKGGSGQVGGDRLARQLRELRQKDRVKAVVLRVNSPGGTVVGSEVIQREVVLLRKTKPVVVSMGSVAASGGYWIATDSDRIFAESSTITGSIGVFGLRPNVQKLGNNNGITWDTIKTGRYADINSITRPRTPQELALLQKQVDQIYDQFLDKVAKSRKLAPAKVQEIAQGRVWSGQRAKSLGLVDELGGLEAAIQDAAKRAKLGNDWQVEEYPKSRNFTERLFGQLTDVRVANQPKFPSVWQAQLEKAQQDLEPLLTLNDPTGIYARLPYTFRFD
jgi:protease-4